MTREFDPQRQLLSRLSGLHGVVVSCRTGAVPKEALTDIRASMSVQLVELTAQRAWPALVARVPVLAKLEEGADGIRLAARRPLEMYLMCEAMSGKAADAPLAEDDLRLTRLWESHIRFRLAGITDSRSWSLEQVLHWLSYQAGSEAAGVLAVNRWPLLLPPAGRRRLLWLRNVGSVTSVCALALLLVSPAPAVLLAAASYPLFLSMSEGVVPRPLALRRVTPTDMIVVARRQLRYLLVFAAGGSLFGAILDQRWAGFLPASSPATVTILVSAATGIGLGLLVPSLYDLFYLSDRQLRRPSPVGNSMRQTAMAALFIGVATGVLLAAALLLVYRSNSALLAVPLCLTLALLDTLALPAAAVLILAVQRRGPFNVTAYLDFLAEVDVLRRYGSIYVF